MLEQYTEERTVKVDVARRVCDLCSEVILPDATFLRIAAGQAQREAHIIMPEGTAVDVLDICTARCLEEKVHVMGLLLNTKIIPGAETAFAEYRKKDDSVYDDPDKL